MATTGNQSSFASEWSFPEFVDLFRRNWVMVREDMPKNASELFIFQEIGSGQGNSKLFNELDGQTYAQNKAEGANAKKAKNDIGYSNTMTAKTIAMEVDITLEMRNDGRYQEAIAYITNLARFCENRIDLDLTHRLTFGTSTSYVDLSGDTVSTTVGDGFALFYNAHTLAASSVTYSNRLTGDPAFSEGAFEAAKLLAATNTYSNFGEKRTMRFNTIWCADHQPTIRAIKQLLESSADVDAVQAGVKNIYQGAMRLVILPNLATTATGAVDSTKLRWWGIAATGDMLNGWQGYFGQWIAPQQVPPTVGNGIDVHSGNWTFGTIARYGITAVSGKGMIASCPTS